MSAWDDFWGSSTRAWRSTSKRGQVRKWSFIRRPAETPTWGNGSVGRRMGVRGLLESLRCWLAKYLEKTPKMEMEHDDSQRRRHTDTPIRRHASPSGGPRERGVVATGAFPNFLDKLKKISNIINMNPRAAGSQYFLRIVTVAFGYTTAKPWGFGFGVLGFEFCVAALAVNAEWPAKDAKWGEVAQKLLTRMMRASSGKKLLPKFLSRTRRPIRKSLARRSRWARRKF